MFPSWKHNPFLGNKRRNYDNIEIINDSTVKVEMLIKNEVQKFIKTDLKV